VIFYLAKILEALGIITIGLNFIVAFPELMNPKLFLAGIFVFVCGWAIERFWVKGR